MSPKLKERKFYLGSNDRVFKEIYGNVANQDLLRGLLKESLSVVLEDTSITTIDYLNSEQNEDNIHVRRKTLDLLLDTNVGRIGLEMNSQTKEYLRSRNYAFYCNMYSHYTLKGEDYSEVKYIIQINYTFGLGAKEPLYDVYQMQTDERKQYVKNGIIIEFNMDKVKKIWYSNDEKRKQELKYLMMIGMNREELKEFSLKDEVAKKYMEEVERVNEDPAFQDYISYEEDKRKIHNTLMERAKEEGEKIGEAKGEQQKAIEMAKKMIGKYPVEEIHELTGLAIEEIERIQNSEENY